jgi:hypothetical protein
MPKKRLKNRTPGRVVVYQAKSGAIELRGDFTKETVWATQAQIVRLFDVDQSVVSRHINNLFKEGEIEGKSNMQKMHNANSDRPVFLYSLDVVLGVGYRTNSKVAVEFRKWATKTLRAHIVDGYTINRTRVAKNYDAFMKAVGEVKALLPSGIAVGDKGILELVAFFADTWLSLDAYDREAFAPARATKKKVALTADTFMQSVAVLKSELMARGEASELFAAERSAQAVEGIIGNVMQSFGGRELYPSIEEKAAHLLYFIVKNHPFADGNKRTGAYAFVWFLHRAKILDRERITPSALTALTLLVAESDPKDKERITGLVTMLLGMPKRI